MKYLILFISCFVLLNTANAQDGTEGQIIYHMNLHLEIDEDNPDLPPEAKAFIQQMPKDVKAARKLTYRDGESLWEPFEDPELIDPNETQITRMMRRNMGNEITYTNSKKNLVVEQREMFGRIFLITDSLKASDWKITGEQQVIAGYPCMKATTMRLIDSVEVTAWFTPSIPTAVGPGGMGQLPGMILAFEADASSGGMRRMSGGSAVITVVAHEIDLRKVKKSEVERPEKGKVVSRKEFQEIMEEKIEEMRQSGGFRRGPR